MDIDALVAQAQARVDARGFCPIRELKIPASARTEVLGRLADTGVEVTKSNVRRPAHEQLRALLATGAYAPLKTLRAQLVATTAAEAKRAALGLVEQGQAHLVLRGSAQVLVPAAAAVLASQDLAALVRRLDVTLKQAKKASRTAGLALLRDDVAAELASFVAPARAAAPRSVAEDLVRRVPEAVAAATDPRLGLAFVPTVVRALAAHADVPAALAATYEAARSGLVELRPESGLGRLSREEQALCVPGPEGSLLSWARLRPEARS